MVVTRGAEGAVAIDRDRRAFRVAGPAVRGPYPVGSGDAFLAGLAVGRLRALTFIEALQLAGAAAAANAVRRGAGHLDVADVERMAGSIVVEPISG